MHKTHGLGYEEYSRKLDQRLEVERKRNEEHQQSKKLVAEVEKQLHR